MTRAQLVTSLCALVVPHLAGPRLHRALWPQDAVNRACYADMPRDPGMIPATGGVHHPGSPDPWGRDWASVGACPRERFYSVGPDGVDDALRGDDLACFAPGARIPWGWPPAGPLAISSAWLLAALRLAPAPRRRLRTESWRVLVLALPPLGLALRGLWALEPWRWPVLRSIAVPGCPPEVAWPATVTLLIVGAAVATRATRPPSERRGTLPLSRVERVAALATLVLVGVAAGPAGVVWCLTGVDAS